jgi:hypothetical protein
MRLGRVYDTDTHGGGILVRQRAHTAICNPVWEHFPTKGVKQDNSDDAGLQFMKSRTKWIAILCVAFLPVAAYALSRSIGRDMEFPKGYDPQKAEAIRKVIRNERFKFVGGNVSYWPPDWGTRLSFEGDAASLNEFLSELRELRGIGLRLVLYRGRDDELRRDSTWQLDFSHARPNQLTVYLNANSTNIDFGKITFPEWPEK